LLVHCIAIRRRLYKRDGRELTAAEKLRLIRRFGEVRRGRPSGDVAPHAEC